MVIHGNLRLKNLEQRKICGKKEEKINIEKRQEARMKVFVALVGGI